ncbi:MAG: 3-deoxy-D-manno-octulosonic acid kinase [Succinivibrio sp.]|nr:3-deoxy-D-manno-octulosonic acid kinase [Succinivibrio sp.]
MASSCLRFDRSCFLLSEDCPQDREETFYQSLFSPSFVERHYGPVIRKEGRGKTILFHACDRSLVLRHYRRGGLYGRIIKDGFFCFEKFSRRSFNEFSLLDEMYAEGLCVPKPFLAREIRKGLFLYNDIIVQTVPKSRNLAEIIAQRELTAEEFERIGLTIRTFFQADIDHTDLNIRNILMDDGGRIFLIDFDKCFRHKLDTERQRQILDRLERSFDKELRLKEGLVHYNSDNYVILRTVALKK